MTYFASHWIMHHVLEKIQWKLNEIELNEIHVKEANTQRGRGTARESLHRQKNFWEKSRGIEIVPRPIARIGHQIEHSPNKRNPSTPCVGRGIFHVGVYFPHYQRSAARPNERSSRLLTAYRKAGGRRFKVPVRFSWLSVKYHASATDKYSAWFILRFFPCFFFFSPFFLFSTA